MGNVANPGNVVGQFPRLQYALMQSALKLKSAPTGAEMQAACREAWEHFQSTRSVEESVTFWGGSEVIDPSGHSLLRAPLHEDGLFIVDIDTDDLRRERLALPVLRDERPELVLRQLERLVRQRAGMADGATE